MPHQVVENKPIQGRSNHGDLPQTSGSPFMPDTGDLQSCSVFAGRPSAGASASVPSGGRTVTLTTTSFMESVRETGPGQETAQEQPGQETAQN